MDSPTGPAQLYFTVMRLLFVADLHYALKQFDWLVAHTGELNVSKDAGPVGLRRAG